MSSRRKSNFGLPPSSTTKTQMNFNLKNEILRENARGNKPTAKPSSVKEVLLQVILHICKKFIFFDVRLKVGLYLFSLFLISLIADFVSFPRSYFSRSDNLFNVYFGKSYCNFIETLYSFLLFI